MISVSRVTSKGQITIPMEFRRKMNIKEGDKVVFLEKDGSLLIANSNRLALEDFQKAMDGVAKSAGLETEKDVSDLVREVRGEIWEDKSK